MGPGRDRSQSPFQVQVKGITGGTTCVMVFGSDRVEEVARQMARVTGIPATEIRLQWRRHVLATENTVRSYGIEKDSVIFASLRLRVECGDLGRTVCLSQS